MMTLAKRLKDRRLSMHMSQEKLAEACHLSQTTIYKIEAGKRPMPHSIERIAQALKTTPAQLLYGDALQNVDTLTNISGPTSQLGKIPILEWSDITKLRKSGNDIIMSIELSETALSRNELPIYCTMPQGCFSITVEGDAMTSPFPGATNFSHGDKLIIDPSLTPKNGNYVIATLSNKKEATFRQYVIDSGIPHLVPGNPKYPLINIDETTEIIGVAIEVIKTIA